VCCIFFIGCDKGLAPAPEPQPYGFEGTIYFQNWPPRNNVIDLRVVVFKNYPPRNIFAEISQGNAKYSETLLPYYGSDSASYTLYLSPLPPGRYEYIVVAQQFGPNIFNDWRAVGVYYANSDTTSPAVLIVPENTVVRGVNINVDFQNPPPQP
jgi:hypothetical protein